MIVISTAYNAPTERICRASVSKQTRPPRQHIYIDASKQDKPLSHSENLWIASQGVPDDEVIVQLDGDDWLAHREVLARLEGVYEDPNVWITYGSFINSMGFKGGNSRPYRPDEDIRTSEWRCTHLKTWRAGLFHRLTARDFKLPDGSWTDVSVDRACMYPMVDMAGWDRVRFIDETMYVYHWDHTVECNMTPMARVRGEQSAKWFANMDRVKRLESL